MFPIRHFLTLLVAGAFSGVAPLPATAASFTGLGDFPGDPFLSASYDLSADGSVVVGYGKREGGRRGQGISEAFRWTASTGLVGLGDLPGGEVVSGARSVSADGSVVVGMSVSELGAEAFRWDGATGMVGLRSSPNGVAFLSAHGISADGSTIIGQGIVDSVGMQAFRWDAVNGPVSLGDLPGEGSYSEAAAVSADGSVIVGYGTVDYSARPFRWDAINGMAELPGLPGSLNSYAAGVSGDGSVIIGNSHFQDPVSMSITIKSFRWDATRGTVLLDDIEGESQQVVAFDISADGSIVVGSGIGTSGVRGAAIWDAVHGWRELDVVLATLGLDLTGWNLGSAQAISADGHAIVGEGRNPNGDLEAWVAVIPEPGTALLLAMGLAGLASHRDPKLIGNGVRGA